MTIMNEGQKYITSDRTIKRYPKFEPEKYIMLRLVPAKWEDKWYQWNQEIPVNASPEAKAQAREFSELKLGYRGDLRFSQVEVFEMTEVMGDRSHPGAGHRLSQSLNINPSCVDNRIVQR